MQVLDDPRSVPRVGPTQPPQRPLATRAPEPILLEHVETELVEFAVRVVGICGRRVRRLPIIFIGRRRPPSALAAQLVQQAPSRLDGFDVPAQSEQAGRRRPQAPDGPGSLPRGSRRSRTSPGDGGSKRTYPRVSKCNADNARLLANCLANGSFRQCRGRTGGIAARACPCAEICLLERHDVRRQACFAVADRRPDVSKYQHRRYFLCDCTWL